MIKLNTLFLYESFLGIFLLLFFLLNTSTLHSQGSIPTVCAEGADKDGDGIANVLDIDSDNDGILDEEESEKGSVSINNQPTTLNGVLISSETSLSAGDVLLISDAIILPSISVDLKITINSVTSGIEYDPTNSNISLTPYNPSMDDLLEVSLVFLEGGTNIPYQLQTIEATFRDIDSQVNRDFTEIIGFSGTPNIIPGNSLALQNYENGGGIAGYMNYGLIKNLNGSATDWVDEENIAISNPDHWITASYENASSFEFTYGVTGTQGNSSGSRGAILSNILYYASRDTDGDGIDDYLDLDSDNDGIPDAIEACGDLTLILENCTLDSNGNATYPDSDGNGCPDGLVSDACNTAPIDTDMDGTPDYLDLDSDGDGCADNIESGTDAFGTSDISGYVSGVVDSDGLLTSGISGSCPSPENNSYIDSNFNACFSCALLATDPTNFCDFIIANPVDYLASEDCDNGGIDNKTECENGGDPNDSCDDVPPILVCPSPQIVTGKGCEVALADYTTAINLMDACSNLSIYTFTQSPVDSTYLTNGIYTINISVTDVNNNASSCNFFLEINLTPPSVPTIFGN